MAYGSGDVIHEYAEEVEVLKKLLKKCRKALKQDTLDPMAKELLIEKIDDKIGKKD